MAHGPQMEPRAVWYPRRQTRRSFGHQRVVQSIERLALRGEDKCVERVIEWRITAVDCTMVVRADEHEVSDIVVPASAEPADVVCFA